MNKNLHLVPQRIEVPAPAPSPTLRERMGEQVSDETLDDTLRSIVGEEVQFLDTEELYGLVPNWPAARLRGLGSGVLVCYDGVVRDVSTANNQGRRFASVEPILEPLAGFNVIDANTVTNNLERYPGGISNTLWVYRVGVSLDQPVRFRTLESGLAEARLFVPASEPVELRLVDSSTTMLQ